MEMERKKIASMKYGKIIFHSIPYHALLMRAKFQTFAYNSRMVRSSCMRFWQQFEIDELYACAKFRVI